MTQKHIRILKDAVEQKFLPFVRRPSRYIGGEINQVKKDLSGCDITVALCFPDVYEIGMSHTGMAVIYNILNRMDNVAAERVFAPWTDAEEILRKEQINLFTLESKAAVGDLDVIGFSLTNELCLTNFLNMLDLAGLKVRSAKRAEDDPLVIAGGQISNCAEPVADFADMFILGEGEEAVVKLVKFLRKQKRKGTGKKEILLQAAKKFNFVYVPSLYKFDYDGEQIKSFKAKQAGLPIRFKNAVVDDLDGATVPEAPIVPFAKAVHERVNVEIMRGCPGRCRFCQASYCRRPIRFRSVDRITQIAKQNYLATGFDTVSLLSLSTADYPQIEELVLTLQEYFEPRHVGISLPSLRVKEQFRLLPKLVTSVRKSGLTIAIEAASEKLRNVIGKPISDEDLFAGIEAAYKAGFQQVKLYFMVGFPGETAEDIARIVRLSHDIALLRRKVDQKTANVNAAVSWLVPKPHTPLGWLGQKEKGYFERAKKIILDEKKQLRARFLQFKFHNIERSILESAIGRGDRWMADIIEAAWRSGARFDLWDECFDSQVWNKAFGERGADADAGAQKSFAEDDILPWEHLGGPGKEYLLGHYHQAMKAVEAL